MQSSIARAVVVLDAVPDKLNPVIRPLIECIKREENILLQVRTEQWLFWPRGYKTFFMLNSTEHKISISHKGTGKYPCLAW